MDLRSTRNGEGYLSEHEALENMRELAMSEDMPMASWTDAEHLLQAGKLLQAELNLNSAVEE